MSAKKEVKLYCGSHVKIGILFFTNSVLHISDASFFAKDDTESAACDQKDGCWSSDRFLSVDRINSVQSN